MWLILLVLGGLGTLVGSPPSAIASAALGYDLPLMFIVLFLVLRPRLNQKISMNIEEIPWIKSRIITLIVLASTALAWIFSNQLTDLTGIKISDVLVALSTTITIVASQLASWDQVAKGTDWGVLILFGVGLTLSAILKDSRASLILVHEVARIFGHCSRLVIIFVVCIFIIILTEFTSNTALAALLVPVFATIADQIGMQKEILVIVIGVGTSCAFMLPVATPPNAIVFETGHLKQRDMIKAGGFLNIGCILIISLFAYF